MAYARGIPIVATNEPFFARREDHEAHDALICIAEGKLVADSERPQLSPEYRFKTRAEMATLFADLPEALASTVEIARRCAFRPTHAGDPILPRFSIGDSGEAVDEAAELRRAGGGWLRAAVAPLRPCAGPHRGGLPRAARLRARRHREDEISGLLPDRRRLHPVGEVAGHSGRAGPRLGRGLARRLCAHHHRPRSDPLRAPVRALPQSGTRVDAGLRHRLLPGPPRRGDPLRAGAATAATSVAQIITFGTLQARGVLRDVGRVLQMPYGQVDKLCKLVPQNPANPVHAASAPSRTSRACRPSAIAIRWSRRAFDIAQKLEGLHRHASTHAAGIVIGDRLALRAGAACIAIRNPNMPVTQFNMKWVEPGGPGASSTSSALRR